MDIYKRIYELENEIAALPQGSINMKKIYGKEQPYLQWTENGKSKSKYIKKNEREEIFAGVERRKQLQEELKELKQHSSIDPSKSTDFETSVIIGERLLALTKGVKNWGKRDCFRQLQAYLNSEETDRVCLVFGLRRTGKTTMLRQAVLGMTPSQSAKSAYIKAKGSDTMAAMNRDLGKLLDLGYEYVFIDEVTLMPDFIDSAALFSDIYAAQGMKIVLSGTDSLGFWFALHQELYDRAVTIHTTFIPFREHSRLLGIDSIDEYIRYGGTLRAGELDFDDKDVISEDASFRDDESTRRYIDTAICKNIQHSLSCCQDGGYFRHLQSLYEAGELTGAINSDMQSSDTWETPRSDSYYQYLVMDKNSSYSTLDYTANEIVKLLTDPRRDQPAVSRKGLILGDVQSGKTRTYIALMNKAADCGYRLIIVLTSDNENLRQQTQERIDTDFIGWQDGIRVGIGKYQQNIAHPSQLTNENDFVAAYDKAFHSFPRPTWNSAAPLRGGDKEKRVNSLQVQ